METRLGNMDPSKNAVWRKNIESELEPIRQKFRCFVDYCMVETDGLRWIDIVNQVRKVCEPLEKLDQIVCPSKDVIDRLRTASQTALRHLDGRARLAELDGILHRNNPWNAPGVMCTGRVSILPVAFDD